jgi:hypothetical protein
MKSSTARSEESRTMSETPKPTTRKSRTKASVATADDRLSRAAAATRFATPSHGDIARRAFELYCDRDCQHGHDLDDWLLAEHELLNR